MPREVLEDTRWRPPMKSVGFVRGDMAFRVQTLGRTIAQRQSICLKSWTVAPSVGEGNSQLETVPHVPVRMFAFYNSWLSISGVGRELCIEDEGAADFYGAKWKQTLVKELWFKV